MKVLLAVLLIASWASLSFAQAATAAVRGTLKNNGTPLAGAQVVLTNMDSGKAYKATADQEGAFEVTGLASGSNYQLEVFNAAGQKVFATPKLAFNADAGTPAAITIDTADMSKTNLGAATEGNRHYTREQIEAMRAQNAKLHTQSVLITQALNAMNAKQWKEAVPPLQQLIANDPGRYEFYQSLGDAQMNLAHNDEAIQAYQKGIQLAGSNNATDPRDPANDPAKKKSRIVSMLANEGNCFLKLKKPDDAIAAFRRATIIDPTSGVAQFNLCASLYNSGKPEALSACEKAITLEPGRPETYFIKGKLLIAKSKPGQNGNMQAPPAAVAALKKYLELRPEGPFAQEAKEMLERVGVNADSPATDMKKK